jgi:hypothetical protein
MGRFGPRSGRNGAMQYLGMCANLDLGLYFQIKGLIRRRGRRRGSTAEFIHKAACGVDVCNRRYPGTKESVRDLIGCRAGTTKGT